MPAGLDISVVICTRNRADLLDLAIRSVLRQSLAPSRFETIVVDNGSTDHTPEVVERFAAGDCRASRLFEPVLGLSRARNAGWRAARGRCIAYLDDDAVADAGWLTAALTCFDECSPAPAAVGGPVRLRWETGEPPWMDEELTGLLGQADYGAAPFDMTGRGRLIGANCFFTRAVLMSLGGFDESLGRKGQCLLSGEETQLQRRIEAGGGRVWYHPAASVEHFVPAERAKPGWFYRRHFWGGVTDFAMRHDRPPAPDALSAGAATADASRISQIRRLVRNAGHALGLRSPLSQQVRSRVYLSYVAGWFAGMLGWHRRTGRS